MIPATCNFCDWTERTNGVWAARRVARHHIEAEHPNEYAELLREEAKARETVASVRKRFGMAANATHF